MRKIRENITRGTRSNSTKPLSFSMADHQIDFNVGQVAYVRVIGNEQ